MRRATSGTSLGMDIRLAATYLGTVVGAGFASGQEHLHFFARFSRGGDLGVVLSGLLFVTLGVMLADLASKHATSSAEDLLALLGGPAAVRATDAVLTVFMFCSVCVMLAGSGALFREHACLPSGLGMGLTGLVAVVAALNGVEGLLSLNTLIAPVLLGAPVAVAALSIMRAVGGLPPRPDRPTPEAVEENMFLPAWPVASVLYVSYNLLLVVAAFAAMGRDLDDARAARRGAALGGVGLLVFMAAIHVTLELHGAGTWRAEVPMLLAASRFGLGLRAVYFAALWVAMVTTAAAACFTFCRRLERRMRVGERTLAVPTVLAAGLLAQVGFGDLVSRVYPIFGYLGLPLVLGLVFAWLRSRFTFIVVT
ncbi:MAG: hypothetical protein ACM3X3_11835 [Betaproteobacteria bacterium]